MKKLNRMIALLLTVCLCAGLMPGFVLTAGAAEAMPMTASPYTYENDRETLERMVLQTALAYFYKGSAIQYGSYHLSRGNVYRSAITNRTSDRLPEDASDLNPIYMVCSAFPQDVYHALFGKHLLTNSLVPPSCKISNAGADTNLYGENDPAVDFLESALSLTARFSYHGAMARNAGMDVTSMLQQEDRDNSGVSAADREKYADVVFYFGPEMNENGITVWEATCTGTKRLYELSGSNLVQVSVNAESKAADDSPLTLSDTYTILSNPATGAAIKHTVVTGTDANGDDITVTYYAVGSREGNNGDTIYTYISTDDYNVSGQGNTLPTVTRAQVEQMFCELLRPGDIVVEMSTNDPEADASDSGHAMIYMGDIDGDGIAEMIHSGGDQYDSSFESASTSTVSKNYVTQATFDAATTVDSIDAQHTFTYGNTQAYRSTLSTTDAQSGAYLFGYELWEGTRGDWSAIASDTAGNGGVGAGSLQGRNGGGSVRINDWISLLGYRRQFASSSKKIDLTKPYGNGRINYSNSGTSAPHYFANDSDNPRKAIQLTVLRPLAKASFLENLSPSAQERQLLQDLSITKTASRNPYQTLTAGDTVTYSVELVNNKGLTSDRTTTTYTNLGSLSVSNTYNVNVTETIPEGTTLVATPSGATVDGNTITWPNVSVADGASGARTLTYTVQVNDGLPLGSTITSPSGKVKSVSSASANSYLSTSKITHLVGGTPLTGVTSGLSLGSTGSGTDIAADVYDSLGIDLTLPSVPDLVLSLFQQDYWANESTANRMKYRLRDPGSLSGTDLLLRKMLVQNYVGGTRVVTYDENGIKSNMNRLRNFSEEFLTPGDILVYADYNRTTDRPAGGEAYVYLGSGHYAHYNSSTGAYENLNAPLKVVQSANNSTRFMYSSVLTQAHRYEFAFLLRPSQALANVTEGCDLSGSVGSAVRVTVDGVTTECGTMEAAANVQRTAIIDAWNAAGSPTSSEWDHPDIQIELLQDLSMNGIAYFYGYGTMDLGGHTLTAPNPGHLTFYVAGGSSAKGGGGDFTIQNGTILGAYTAIYLSGTNNTMHLDNVTVLGGDMRDGEGNSVSYTSGVSDLSWGHAIKKLSNTNLYLNNCVLGTAGTEKPIHNGSETSPSSDNTIHIQDNVTFLIPTTIVAGHSGWNTGSNTTMVRDTNPNSAKAVRYTRSSVWHGTLNEAYPGPAQDYTVVTYTTTPAARAGGLQKATLSDALADTASGKTISLLRNVDLTARQEVGLGGTYNAIDPNAALDITIPAGVTLDPGAYALTGQGNVFVKPGATYGQITVPQFFATAEGLWKQDAGYLAQPALWSAGAQALTLLDGIVVNAAVPVQPGKSYFARIGENESVTPAVEQGGYATFDLRDCFAFEMTVPVTATLLETGNGVTAISAPQTFSIKRYADGALTRVNWAAEEDVGSVFGAKLGRTMVAMLNYGALAQTYFEENTESPANADLTSEQQTALSTVYTTEVLNNNRSSAPVTATGANPEAYYGTSCVLGRKLDMKFYFRLANTAGITGTVSYTDHEGNVVETSIAAQDLVVNGNYHTYKVAGLNAADICSDVTVTLRQGGQDLVTVTDSIADYTARTVQNRIAAVEEKEIALRDLADAMMIFGLAAADYLPGSNAPANPYTPEVGETGLS